jgi:hypothetical protein
VRVATFDLTQNPGKFNYCWHAFFRPGSIGKPLGGANRPFTSVQRNQLPWVYLVPSPFHGPL